MRERYTFGDCAFAVMMAVVLAVSATGIVHEHYVEKNYEYAPLLTPWVAP